MTIHFPFETYWSFYVGFTIFVFALLALDLGLFHRKAHEVRFKEALAWSVAWVALALTFNFLFYQYALWKFTHDPNLTGPDALSLANEMGLQFLGGYIVEKSLSLDNIFVFFVVFSSFSIPATYQHRILYYGILGALIFRAIFIAAGSFLIQYEAVVIIFGLFLILTGVKLCFASKGEIDPSKNRLIKYLSKRLRVTQTLEGSRFFVKKQGLLYITPLFLALIFVEMSDIIFAVDSVPAIFAITREPLIVFTSNVFAILGLRAMYFLLASIVDRFYLLKYGLSIILIFVGLKMTWLNNLYGGEFPITWSLLIITSVVACSIVFSLVVPTKAHRRGRS